MSQWRGTAMGLPYERKMLASEVMMESFSPFATDLNRFDKKGKTKWEEVFGLA